MKSWPSKVKNSFCLANDFSSKCRKKQPVLIIKFILNSCQNNLPKILVFSYQHQINPSPRHLFLLAYVMLHSSVYFLAFPFWHLNVNFLQSPFPFSPNLTAFHPGNKCHFYSQSLKFIPSPRLLWYQNSYINCLFYFHLDVSEGISNLTYHSENFKPAFLLSFSPLQIISIYNYQNLSNSSITYNPSPTLLILPSKPV